MQLIIYGNLPRKSNNRQLVWNKKTGKPKFIKSDKALAYEEDFAKQITGNYKQKLGSKDKPLRLTARIYYETNKSDVSDELLCDLLQKCGVIADDRYIKEKHLFGEIDKRYPRVELTLEYI